MTVSPFIVPDDLKFVFDKIDARLDRTERSLLIEPWKPISLSTNIKNYITASSWGPFPRYTRDRFGFVHLEGLISGTAASGVELFNLPVGYRPPFNRMFACQGSVVNAGTAVDGALRCDMEPTGKFSCLYGGNWTWNQVVNNYLTLSGITFYAEL